MPNMIESSENKRIAKNTAYLYVRMFFALIINLYTSRVILNALGVEDFGVFNVVAGFVSLFGFFNATLSTSVQRFYNYEESKNGKEGFTNVYVTSFVIHLVMTAVLAVLLETVGLWYVNDVMVLPEYRLRAANILFQTTVVSMLLMVLQIPYVGAVMAKENMDFYAVVSILDLVLKLGAAIAVAHFECDGLILYGVLLAAVSVIDILLYVSYSLRHFPEMRFSRSFDKAMLKSILSFSGWNLTGTFAFMLKGQGVNMLLNYFFGPAVNAARGISYQVNGAVSNFTSAIYTAFNPQVTKSYAEGNISRTMKIMFTESKICFSLIAILIVPVILEMDYLLHLWLGDVVPENTGIFASLVLIDTLICTLNTPCTQAVFATGRIKNYQIFSSLVNVSLIPLVWVMLRYGASATSAFVVTIIVSVLNQVVCLCVTNMEYHFGIGNYTRQILLRISALAIMLPLAPCLLHFLMPVSFWRVLIVSLASAVFGLFIVYYVVLCKGERDMALLFVKSKICK